MGEPKTWAQWVYNKCIGPNCANNQKNSPSSVPLANGPLGSIRPKTRRPSNARTPAEIDAARNANTAAKVWRIQEKQRANSEAALRNQQQQAARKQQSYNAAFALRNRLSKEILTPVSSNAFRSGQAVTPLGQQFGNRLQGIHRPLSQYVDPVTDYFNPPSSPSRGGSRKKRRSHRKSRSRKNKKMN